MKKRRIGLLLISSLAMLGVISSCAPSKPGDDEEPSSEVPGDDTPGDDTPVEPVKHLVDALKEFEEASYYQAFFASNILDDEVETGIIKTPYAIERESVYDDVDEIEGFLNHELGVMSYSYDEEFEFVKGYIVDEGETIDTSLKVKFGAFQHFDYSIYGEINPEVDSITVDLTEIEEISDDIFDVFSYAADTYPGIADYAESTTLTYDPEDESITLEIDVGEFGSITGQIVNIGDESISLDEAKEFIESGEEPGVSPQLFFDEYAYGSQVVTYGQTGRWQAIYNFDADVPYMVYLDHGYKQAVAIVPVFGHALIEDNFYYVELDYASLDYDSTNLETDFAYEAVVEDNAILRPASVPTAEEIAEPGTLESWIADLGAYVFGYILAPLGWFDFTSSINQSFNKVDVAGYDSYFWSVDDDVLDEASWVFSETFEDEVNIVDVELGVSEETDEDYASVDAFYLVNATQGYGIKYTFTDGSEDDSLITVPGIDTFFDYIETIEEYKEPLPEPEGPTQEEVADEIYELCDHNELVVDKWDGVTTYIDVADSLATIYSSTAGVMYVAYSVTDSELIDDGVYVSKVDPANNKFTDETNPTKGEEAISKSLITDLTPDDFSGNPGYYVDAIFNLDICGSFFDRESSYGIEYDYIFEFTANDDDTYTFVLADEDFIDYLFADILGDDYLVTGYKFIYTPATDDFPAVISEVFSCETVPETEGEDPEAFSFRVNHFMSTDDSEIDELALNMLNIDTPALVEGVRTAKSE